MDIELEKYTKEDIADRILSDTWKFSQTYRLGNMEAVCWFTLFCHENYTFQTCRAF